MKETNLIEDLSTLTTIPQEALNKLITKAIWCICDTIQESKLQNSTTTKINIGLGNLIIIDEDEQIKYKFIPNTELEDGVRDTLIEGKNPLSLTLEKTLVSKILKTYKDII